MIATLLVASALAGAVPRQHALAVMFPDRDNPDYYHVMSCRGKVVEQTPLRLARNGVPSPAVGRVVFRCNGPLDTYIKRAALEPAYFHDTDWAWSFESSDGRELLSGVGAKLMRPVAQGLHLYVREGYADP